MITKPSLRLLRDCIRHWDTGLCIRCIWMGDLKDEIANDGDV